MEGGLVSILNMLSVAFLLCVFPNLDKANMDLSPKSAQTEHGTSDSVHEIIHDLIRSLK